MSGTTLCKYLLHLRRLQISFAQKACKYIENFVDENSFQNGNHEINMSEDKEDRDSEPGKVNGITQDDDYGGANIDICHKEENIRMMNARFLLETKEMHKLSQKAVDTIVRNTTSIVQNSLELVKCRLLSLLENDDMPDVCELLENVFMEENVVTNPFLGMESKWQQDNFFRDVMGVVVSF